MAARSHRLVFDLALCHASLLVERSIFYSRNLGLLPRTSTANDPLGPIVVSDEDVTTILSGFRRIRQTEETKRRQLLVDPMRRDVDESRAALLDALNSDKARRVGFAELVRSFELGAENVIDPFILAIAPEWDARIARLFGFLNNDLSRQRPTYGHLLVSLQQGLPTLDIDAAAVLEERLLAPGLIYLDEGADAPRSGQTVRVPGHVVALTLSVLNDAKPNMSWEKLNWEEDNKQQLRESLERELATDAARRLVILEGTPGSGRSASVAAAVRAAGHPLLTCNLNDLVAANAERRLTEAFYRARAASAVLVVRSDGALQKSADLWTVIGLLSNRLSVATFVLLRPDEPQPPDSSLRFVRVAMPRLRPKERRAIWEQALADAQLPVAASVLDDASTRFDVTPGRIHELTAEIVRRRGSDHRTRLRVPEVSDALREITSQKLRDLAGRYLADLALDDLVLAPQARDRLVELAHRLRHRYSILDGWGFGGRSMRGYGVSALFAGPPGTGKTAAAAAVAHMLEIDLYVVDLSRIMSKWVGETEQNLAKVFDEAEASSVALLFDEADSLFGKRSSEVKSASDRYANVTVNYLLQRMERYSGLAILTTNLESAIDAAFSRRITTRVQFDMPDEKERLTLWNQLLPKGVQFATDVDLRELARRLEMPGARIRNALLRSAFRAAASGRKQALLTQEDLYWGAAAEYEDMGRLPALLGERSPEPAPVPDETPPPPSSPPRPAGGLGPRPTLPSFPFPRRSR